MSNNENNFKHSDLTKYFIKDIANTAQKELDESLEIFNKNTRPVISVFGSARDKAIEDIADDIELLGYRLASKDFVIINGGYLGAMGAISKGAYKAWEEKGKDEEKPLSIGFSIDIPTEHGINKYLNATYQFNHFFTRKVALTVASDAFVIFPGGFGTLDEVFTTATQIQTNKLMSRLPIMFYNKDNYWGNLKAVIEGFKEKGTISPNDDKVFMFCNSIEEIERTITDCFLDNKCI